MEPLRVLIADDHPLFRHGLFALLNVSPDFEVVGEATSGEEVVTMAAKLQPDLILTMFEDDASVFTAMRAGARGYVLKDAQKADMLAAIQAVGRGEAIFSPTIATRLIDFFAAPRPAVPPQAFPELTEREREILDLIAKGHSNTEIATRLVLSPNTVRNYVSNVFSKLQVADRAQAIIRARESGLGYDSRSSEQTG